MKGTVHPIWMMTPLAMLAGLEHQLLSPEKGFAIAGGLKLTRATLPQTQAAGERHRRGSRDLLDDGHWVPQCGVLRGSGHHSEGHGGLDDGLEGGGCPFPNLAPSSPSRGGSRFACLIWLGVRPRCGNAG